MSEHVQAHSLHVALSQMNLLRLHIPNKYSPAAASASVNAKSRRSSARSSPDFCMAASGMALGAVCEPPNHVHVQTIVLRQLQK